MLSCLCQTTVLCTMWSVWLWSLRSLRTMRSLWAVWSVLWSLRTMSTLLTMCAWLYASVYPPSFGASCSSTTMSSHCCSWSSTSCPCRFCGSYCPMSALLCRTVLLSPTISIVLSLLIVNVRNCNVLSNVYVTNKANVICFVHPYFILASRALFLVHNNTLK